MVERVIFHIGMPKAGSTALQNALEGYDDGEAFFARFGDANHSRPLVTIFANEPSSFTHWRKLGSSPEALDRKKRIDLQQLKADLARADRKTLILSAEMTAHLDADEQDAMIGFLIERAPRLEVVCYLRDPLSFAASALQQRVKWDHACLPIDRDWIDPHYTARLARFESALPASRIHVIPYLPQRFPNGSVVADFCQRFDLTPLEGSRANESLSLPVLRLMLAFNMSNRLSMGDQVLVRARQALVAALSKGYAGSPPIEKDRFACLCAPEDLQDFRARAGDDAVTDMPVSKKTGTDALVAYLTDLDAVPRAPLDQLLQENGLTGRYPEIEQKLNRLFYHFVAQAGAEIGQDPGRLTFADGDRLRDMSISIARGETLGLDAALDLMELAVRAKPNAQSLKDRCDDLRALLAKRGRAAGT